ncbi:MAG: iron-sulfur cluster assembly scaffold protein [Dehalococcoidia bacterium]
MPRGYSDKLMDHFSNPRNVGVIEDADAVGVERNDACGDTTTLYLKVRDDAIVVAKFQTLGCGAAIATSSVATVLLTGARLEEARKLGRKDLADALGGLPPGKVHCSVLAADALKSAIKDYDRKKASRPAGSPATSG